jgi:hypothetical protein
VHFSDLHRVKTLLNYRAIPPKHLIAFQSQCELECFMRVLNKIYTLHL